MGLLHLVKEHDRIRLPADRFRQLSAFIISHISRRRSDQPGYRIFLHILAHIDTDHVALIIKQILSKRFCKLRLPHARRTKEQEGTDRLGGILDPRLRADDGFRYQFYSFVLTDHTLMKLLRQMKGLAPLTLVELRNRNTSPTRHDLADLIIRHALMHQRLVFILHLSFLLF